MPNRGNKLSSSQRLKNMNSWLFCALCSAFFGALVPIFGKIGLKGIDSNTATAIRAVIMALFLVAVIVFQGKSSQINPIISNHKALAFIVLSGLAGAMSWLFYFLALDKGCISQVVPIDRLSLAFAVMLSVLFFGDKPSLHSAFGIILMIAGAIFISI